MLFHDDNDTFYDLPMLRGFAASIVRESSLIRRAWIGDRNAAKGLHLGFWQFVREFELAIDRQSLPRLPLIAKFGTQTVRKNFTSIAKEVKEMKKEEGTHAQHWLKDGENLGIDNSEFYNVKMFPKVQELINRSYSNDLSDFFAVLAGTEYIAEELSRYLLKSDKFKNLFARKRWVWGEVHLVVHQGPSHLDIDLDLARAYNDYYAAHYNIEQGVKGIITLFNEAANQIELVY